MSRSLYAAWLAKDPAALSLVGADARDPQIRQRAATLAANNQTAPAVIAELRRQSAGLPADPSRDRSIERLAQPGTVAMITGQQVGLFLGPLYTFYKAATAIAAARALEAETGTPCVPVFWLQTEDHDFAEIDHCEVLPPSSMESGEQVGADPAASAPASTGVVAAGAEREPVRIALTEPADALSDRVAVGHRLLGPSVERCVAELAASLEGQPFAEEVLGVVRRHYRPGARIASAFAGMLAELFSGEGLILFDPRQRAVAELWAPMLEHALRDEQRISFLLEERSAAIRAAGFEPQVHVRPGSPLLFVHPDGAEGPRYRIDRQEGDRYLLVGTERTVTLDQVFLLARRDPFSLSSSALLRPILQDTLFPTAAYVGGPGELGYAAQLAPLYRHFGMTPTLFLPRAGFRLVDARTRRALEALGLKPEDASAPEETLLERTGLQQGTAPEELERSVLVPALAALEAAAGTATALDPQLERAVVRTRETIRRAVSRFSGRYARARLQRSAVALRRLNRIRATLFPGGEPQERRYAWPAFAATFGVEALRTAVFASLRPFEPGTRDLLP